MKTRLLVTSATIVVLVVTVVVIVRWRATAPARRGAAQHAPAERPASRFASIPWSDEPLDWSRPVKPFGEASAPGYAGAAACTPCHEEIAGAFARHSMATTGLRPLAAQDQRRLASIFDRGTVIRHEASGFSYRPYREGERYFVEELVDSSDGVRLHSWVMPITMSLSAGSYGMAFGFRQGDRVYQVPIDFNPELDRWGVDPGYLERNWRFARPFSAFCVSCHSEHPRHRATSLELMLDPLPQGIGCERCHGPGARHSETGAVADIVNPAKLPTARQLDVCAQCHLQGETVQRAGRDMHSFRPGEPLHAFRMNYLDDPPAPGEFALLAHSERLLRSACWQGSRDTMTCTTCHDPHRSSREVKAAEWDAKCQGCHAQKPCTGDPVERQKVDDHCVRCHMRRATPNDVTFVLMTDHWIQRTIAPAGPPDAPTRRQRGLQPQRLVAYASLFGETPEGPDLLAVEGAAYANAGLFEEATARLADGVAGWPAVREAYQLIAVAYDAQNQPHNRARAFAAILRFDPDDREALLGYAGVLLAAGPPGSDVEALRAIDRLLALWPDDPEALELKGLYHFTAGRLDEARPLLERAVAAGPDRAKAYVALAAMARRAGDHEAAREHLVAALRIDPWDQWIVDTLAAEYDAADDAEGAARQRAIGERLAASAPGGRRGRTTEWLPQEWR